MAEFLSFAPLAASLLKEAAIGLAGAAIGASLIELGRRIKNQRLRAKYPIQGSYLAIFEDETGGVKYIAKSSATISQNGLSFTGVNTNPEGRSWLLEGKISSTGYVSGIYIAKSPYDPGHGTFFLKISGQDLEGLWSGYDSVNFNITSGRYSFIRTSKLTIEQFDPRHTSVLLSIADSALGAGYLNELSSGDGFHSVSTIVGIQNNKVVGFAVYNVEDSGFLESSKKYEKVHFTPDLKAADRAGLLGHIRIVAVDPNCQGRGIGSALVAAAEQRLQKLGAQEIILFGWTSDKGTHIGGILEQKGFHQFDEVEKFWHDESLELGYDCAVCGRPCNCKVITYKKALS